MIRTFIIYDTPNDQGFDRFTVKTDHGKPYLEAAEPISTNDPGDLFRALLEWVQNDRP